MNYRGASLCRWMFVSAGNECGSYSGMPRREGRVAVLCLGRSRNTNWVASWLRSAKILYMVTVNDEGVLPCLKAPSRKHAVERGLRSCSEDCLAHSVRTDHYTDQPRYLASARALSVDIPDVPLITDISCSLSSLEEVWHCHYFARALIRNSRTGF